MLQPETKNGNIHTLINKLDKTIEKKLEPGTNERYNKTVSKLQTDKSDLQKEDYRASDDILDHMREKYSKKAEKVDKIKDGKRKEKAAVVMTKKRYREVIAVLKKSGNALSESMMNAKKESVRLLSKTKSQTRICKLNKEIKGALTTLGREVYDLNALGVSDVLENKNIVKIIGTINETHVEKELICEKFGKKTK